MVAILVEDISTCAVVQLSYEQSQSEIISFMLLKSLYLPPLPWDVSCVCVCVCVCVCESACVCVCVCVGVIEGAVRGERVWVCRCVCDLAVECVLVPPSMGCDLCVCVCVCVCV